MTGGSPNTGTVPDEAWKTERVSRQERFARRVMLLPEHPELLIFNPYPWTEPPVSRVPPAWGAITTDRLRLLKADIVLFHLPDVGNWARLPRRDNQLWIGATMEPDAIYPVQKSLPHMGTLDLLCSWHEHADLRFNYTWPGTLEEVLQPIPAKRGFVCSFISNPVAPSGRCEFIDELGKHIPIDHYGAWNRNCEHPPGDPREVKRKLLREYRFCLAFENSIHPGYITEKWFDCFRDGCVAVYLGAPDAASHAPSSDSWLDVNTFPSHAALAAELLSFREGDAYASRFYGWKNLPLPESFTRLYDSALHKPLLQRLWEHIEAMRQGAFVP